MQKALHIAFFEMRFKLKCFRIASKQYLLYIFSESVGQTLQISKSKKALSVSRK